MPDDTLPDSASNKDKDDGNWPDDDCPGPADTPRRYEEPVDPILEADGDAVRPGIGET